MKTLEELRKLKAEKAEEIRKLLGENKTDEAKTATEELRGINDQIEILVKLEEEERKDFERQRTDIVPIQVPEAPNEMRSIVKHVMGKEMTQEERATIVSSDNAAVLPSQFINQLQEIKKGYGSIKDLCDIIPVTKNTGTIPVVDYDQNTLADVAEGADITDGTLVTTQLSFTCSKVGLIQTLSSELVEDAEIEIETIANNNFAEIAVAKENKKILDIIAANATAITDTDGDSDVDYQDLENVIDTALPGYKAGLITITNPTGFAYLNNLKDSTGAPLKLVTFINGTYYFHEKPLVVVDGSLLTLTAGKTKIFYSLNMKEAVKFIERKGVTVARSIEAGFTDDTIKLRILERIAAIKGSTRSIKKLELA